MLRLAQDGREEEHGDTARGAAAGGPALLAGEYGARGDRCVAAERRSAVGVCAASWDSAPAIGAVASSPGRLARECAVPSSPPGRERIACRRSGWRSADRDRVGARPPGPGDAWLFGRGPGTRIRDLGGPLSVLTLPASVRIYVAAEAVDLRRGFDGLAAAV